MTSLIRTFIFCFLFATGFGAISIAILASEFDVYYNNKQYKEYVDYQIEVLKEQRVVNSDKLTLLYGDPEIKLRLGNAIFGVDPISDDTYFPSPDKKLTEESLSVIKEILGDEFKINPKPQWVVTINKKQNNDVLLYGGIVIVAFSMFFFIETKKKDEATESDFEDEN